MSGGSWDYFCYKCDDVADRLRSSRDPIRRAFGAHMAKVAAAMKAIEWHDSRDTSDSGEAEIRACLQPGDELAEVVADGREVMARLEALLPPTTGAGEGK